MQRATSRPFVRCTLGLAWVVMALFSSSLGAQVLDYVCEGELRTDKIFEVGGVSSAHQRFRITANIAAGYVKRDRELAAGCFAGRTEVCACEPPGPESIVCRSLGFRPDGTEVSLDFTLRHRDQILNITGKEFNARSGTLIETQGQLACSRLPANAEP